MLAWVMNLDFAGSGAEEVPSIVAADTKGVFILLGAGLVRVLVLALR